MEISLFLAQKVVNGLVGAAVYICDYQFPALGTSLHHLAYKAFVYFRKLAP